MNGDDDDDSDDKSCCEVTQTVRGEPSGTQTAKL